MDAADWGEKWALYESGSGTASLTFAHEVLEPNESSQSIAVPAHTLALNGGRSGRRRPRRKRSWRTPGSATTPTTRWTGSRCWTPRRRRAPRRSKARTPSESISPFDVWAGTRSPEGAAVPPERTLIRDDIGMSQLRSGSVRIP